MAAAHADTTYRGVLKQPDKQNVANRENLRIQRFDPEGRFLGLWELHGMVFALKWTSADALWAAVQPHDVPNGSEGWLVKLDPMSGDVIGKLPAFGHSIEVSSRGDVLAGGILPGSRPPTSAIVFRPQ